MVFFGVDGAGKSTHLRLLKDFLRGEGKRVRSTWIAHRHLSAYLLSEILMKAGHETERSGRTFYSPSMPMRRSLLQRVWLALETISVLAAVLHQVRLPKAFGYTVLVERYLFDTIAYFAYFIRRGFFKTLTCRMLLSLIRQKDVFSVMLDVEHSDIAKRRGYHPDDIAEPAGWIQFQRQVYRKLARDYASLVLNTSGLDVESIQEIIRKRVKETVLQS